MIDRKKGRIRRRAPIIMNVRLFLFCDTDNHAVGIVFLERLNEVALVVAAET